MRSSNKAGERLRNYYIKTPVPPVHPSAPAHFPIDYPGATAVTMFIHEGECCNDSTHEHNCHEQYKRLAEEREQQKAAESVDKNASSAQTTQAPRYTALIALDESALAQASKNTIRSWDDTGIVEMSSESFL